MLQQRFQRSLLSEVRRRCSSRSNISSNTARPFVSMTRPMWEKHSVAVPTMGDSITEGTVVEWAVTVGQAVKTEDVVALIETDKVTIDIKATMNGVITQQFVPVNESVEVGAPLYEIDTEAEATVASATSESSKDTSAAAATAPVEIIAAAPSSADNAQQQQQQQQEHQHHHRVPMIKFLGKDGWERVLSGKQHAEAATPAPTPAALIVASSSSPLAITVVDSSMIHPMYGRPIFTNEEMETLILGGANRAPIILSNNSVTKFKQVM